MRRKNHINPALLGEICEVKLASGSGFTALLLGIIMAPGGCEYWWRDERGSEWYTPASEVVEMQRYRLRGKTQDTKKSQAKINTLKAKMPLAGRLKRK